MRTKIDGIKPNGQRFTIETTWSDGTVKSRRLQLHAFGDVGAIGIPMQRECWYGQLYYELTRNGEACRETARNCFAIFEGPQNTSEMPE